MKRNTKQILSIATIAIELITGIRELVRAIKKRRGKRDELK